MKITAIIVLFCCLLSCSEGKKDCIDIMTGTYKGTCSDAGGIVNGKLTINRWNGNYAGFFNLIEIQDEIFYKGFYVGQISDDCKSININYNSVGNISDSLSITGVLFITGRTIEGDIHFYRSGNVKDCTYTLVKL